MNYGSISQTYSIIPYQHPRKQISKHFQKQIAMVHEASPLIRKKLKRTKTYESLINCKVLMLFLILIAGLTTGIYLLAVEYQEQNVNFRYNLIELNTWYGRNASSALFLNQTKLELPVTNVIVSHTRGDHCYSTEKCSALLRDMINDLADIPYNFLISAAGDSYELLGWNYASDLPAIFNKDSSIVLGFIGNFTTETLTEKQFDELNAFINEAIRNKKLTKNFHVYGIQSDLKMHETLDDLEQWNGILL